MRPFQGRTMILTHQRIILAGEISQISHGASTTMTTHGRIMQATSIIPIILPIINPTFQIILTILPTIFQIITKLSQPSPPSSFQNPQLERRMTDFERNIERYMKNQDSLMQTKQRLEGQMSQLANPHN